MMNIGIAYLLFLSLFSWGVMAQENPFRSLRDGDQPKIAKALLKEANERFSAEEIKVIEEDLKNYFLKPFSNKEFHEMLEAKEFFQREEKKCKHQFRNVFYDCKKFLKKVLLAKLRAENILDDVSYLALKNSKYALDLITIEQKFYFMNLQRELNNPDNAYTPFEYNPMTGVDFRMKVGKLTGLTPRQRLYLLYSDKQITWMADLIKRASQIMNAKSVTINFDFDGDGTEDLPPMDLSYTGKYNLAIKIVRHEVDKQKNQGGLFAGLSPNYTDLLASAMEAGYFNAKEMTALLEFEELRDPKKVEQWKKVGKIALIIGKAALMAIPGVGPLIAIPVILAEAIIETQRQNHAKKDNSDILD